MAGCIQCGKSLTYNEIGATKKFLNRGSREFLCFRCLGDKLNLAQEDMERKIEEFKLQGCSLFL